MKPNKTLSSFLLESEFYENLQIVSSAPVLSPIQENNLLNELKSLQTRRRSSFKPHRINSVSKFYSQSNNLRASGCSSMLEPNSIRSQELDSEDWVNGNWQSHKSDTLLKFDELSIRDNYDTSSSLEDNINLYLDLYQGDSSFQQRLNSMRKCHFLVLLLCFTSAIISFICIFIFILLY